MKKATIFVALTAAVGVLALSLLFWQPRHAPFVVGVVTLSDVDNKTIEGFRMGLSDLGHPEGDAFIVRVFRPAGSIDNLAPIIEDHLRQGVDLFLVSSTPGTLAVKRMTEGTGIPVVFSPVNDPVGAGIVDNLQHPGGNITGIRLPVGEEVRLEWLVRLSPTIRRVLVPYNPEDQSAETSLQRMMGAAAKLGVIGIPLPLRTREEVRAAVAALPDGIDAVYIPRDSLVGGQSKAFVTASVARKLPLSVPSFEQVEQGALIGYGFTQFELGRQAARLADQILFHDVAPGDLPVEFGRNYLSINMKAAAAIGLTVPDQLLQQASNIIR